MPPPITRRTALRSFAGAAAAATLPAVRAADGESSRPAPMSKTMPPANSLQHSACKWCYPKIALEDLARAGREFGLASIELLNPEDFPTLKKHGLTCAMVSSPTGKTPQGVTVGGIPKAFNRLEHHDTLAELYTRRIAETADAGFEKLICFSGNRDGLGDEQGLANCVSGLQRILPLAERRGVTLCMELLNSKVNHKDYMCDHTAWGVELVKRVGSERFRLLYDIYHMQIMEGDVIATIQACHEFIAHYHTGGVPGRHEIDDTQELNYPAIVRAIQATGYRGFLGQEFVPARDPLTSLAAAIKLCTV
jgi:hydroxypyruvate isomerase